MGAGEGQTSAQAGLDGLWDRGGLEVLLLPRAGTKPRWLGASRCSSPLHLSSRRPPPGLRRPSSSHFLRGGEAGWARAGLGVPGPPGERVPVPRPRPPGQVPPQVPSDRSPGPTAREQAAPKRLQGARGAFPLPDRALCGGSDRSLRRPGPGRLPAIRYLNTFLIVRQAAAA
jgi:hypothetical protein